MRDDIKNKIHTSSKTQIDLINIWIQDGEIDDIIQEVIQQRPDVESIFLSNNAIQDSGAVLLSAGCQLLEKLIFLDLQFNQIDKSGAEALLKLITIKPPFQCALHGNKINNSSEIAEITPQIEPSETVTNHRF